MTLHPNSRNRVTLVTGACRSGKSEWAEKLATQSKQSILYIATAQANPDDPEWQNRISLHQQRRPADWKTLAEPIAIAPIIQSAKASECLLIDSLGTWLANFLEQDEAAWQMTVQDFLTSLEQTSGSIILVAEETGWGVVPAYPIGRLFRDRLGSLTRRVGALAQTVYLVTAGYALDLTQLGTPLDR
jgi:adenosylcobinamide kinase / adenosylcobinamide-phosphate guanylyltransferase